MKQLALPAFVGAVVVFCLAAAQVSVSVPLEPVGLAALAFGFVAERWP
jgi:hypothetical protein